MRRDKRPRKPTAHFQAWRFPGDFPRPKIRCRDFLAYSCSIISGLFKRTHGSARPVWFHQGVRRNARHAKAPGGSTVSGEGRKARDGGAASSRMEPPMGGPPSRSSRSALRRSSRAARLRLVNAEELAHRLANQLRSDFYQRADLWRDPRATRNRIRAKRLPYRFRQVDAMRLAAQNKDLLPVGRPLFLQSIPSPTQQTGLNPERQRRDSISAKYPDRRAAPRFQHSTPTVRRDLIPAPNRDREGADPNPRQTHHNLPTQIRAAPKTLR